jgi:cysteine-rich repeat protein
MTSTSTRLPIRLRAIAQLGTAAILAIAVAAGCGSSDDSSNKPGSGGNTGSAGTPSGGTSGAGASSAGSAGTAGTGNGAGFAGGLMMGQAGSPEAGAPNTPSAVCGNGTLDPGEECDDGNTKDGDGCSSICTNKCELCEAAAKCATDPNSDSLNAFDLCYGTGAFATTPASAGPAAGTARNKLCQSLVACLRKSNCAAQDPDLPFTPCYCGSADQADCQGAAGPKGAAATGPSGPCVNEFANAAESRTYSDIASRLGTVRESDTGAAVGAAMSIITACDAVACPRQCFQDKDPSTCEKCAIGPTPLGYQYVCPDYEQCYFGPEVQVIEDSSAPKNLPLSQLCGPAVDCALQTGCAAKGVVGCYGNGSGPCAAQFAAAADSSDPATILTRLQLGSGFPVATAASLLDCEATSCTATCFPNASAGAGGTGGMGGGAGTGGASAGTGGANAGTGGASAGTGGSGGANAGTGGASAGTGGSGGANAGTGGASAGSGGA